ncbi:MAG: hypothetical protein HYS12_21395 [Planctomycetes bacterium]|nr:hypothetical protein [Planctomycetota bacterium]
MAESTLVRMLPRNLAETLERQIDQRTWHRVRRLRVDADTDRLVVHGLAPSYYVKQLALAAVGEVTAAGLVEVDIQVR